MRLISEIYNFIHKIAYKSLVCLDSFVNARWYSKPYGTKPHASKKEYLALAEIAKKNTSNKIFEYEKKYGYMINTIWLNNLALHTQIVKKKSTLSYVHGRIIYTTLMEYLRKNKTTRINIIETGSARGFSALCMAKALEDSQREGLIITFDIIPHHKKMIWNCIGDHDGQKTRAQILSPWQGLIDRYILFHQGYTRLELAKVQLDRVHFAFLDGAHGYEDVMFEFSKIRDKQHSGDVIVYDDYNKNQFPGLVKAVDEICLRNSYKRIDINGDSERAYVIAIKK